MYLSFINGDEKTQKTDIGNSIPLLCTKTNSGTHRADIFLILKSLCFVNRNFAIFPTLFLENHRCGPFVTKGGEGGGGNAGVTSYMDSPIGRIMFSFYFSETHSICKQTSVVVWLFYAFSKIKLFEYEQHNYGLCYFAHFSSAISENNVMEHHQHISQLTFDTMSTTILRQILQNLVFESSTSTCSTSNSSTTII